MKPIKTKSYGILLTLILVLCFLQSNAQMSFTTRHAVPEHLSQNGNTSDRAYPASDGWINATAKQINRSNETSVFLETTCAESADAPIPYIEVNVNGQSGSSIVVNSCQMTFSFGHPGSNNTYHLKVIDATNLVYPAIESDCSLAASLDIPTTSGGITVDYNNNNLTATHDASGATFTASSALVAGHSYIVIVCCDGATPGFGWGGTKYCAKFLYKGCGPVIIPGKVICLEYNSDEFLCAINESSGSRILKLKKDGGTGSNMFKIQFAANSYSNLPGYSYLLGEQIFTLNIQGLYLINGNLIITFCDGRVLKIKNSGGTGSNMFKVNQTATGFSTVPGSNHYLGDAKFITRIMNMSFVNSKLIMAFLDGKMLKVSGDGGTGSNMFAVTETATGFNTVSSPGYRLGDAMFNSPVNSMAYVNSKLIMAMQDGKMLKVSGDGGTGSNMFAVTESASGFTTVSGYNYRLGDTKFNSPVTSIAYVNGKLIMAMQDGKILKVSGDGGTGSNMFAVTETATGFTTVPGYNYRLGDAKFNSPVARMAFVNNKLIMAFQDGKMLKVSGDGGTGSNMFAVTESASGFSTVPGYNYRLGDAKFNTQITNMIFINNKLIMVFQDGKILKVSGDGGTGSNMFAVTETTTGFNTVPNYSYYLGYQKFN